MINLDAVSAHSSCRLIGPRLVHLFAGEDVHVRFHRSIPHITFGAVSIRLPPKARQEKNKNPGQKFRAAFDQRAALLVLLAFLRRAAARPRENPRAGLAPAGCLV